MASCVEQATESTISLKGSTKMVSEFFCKLFCQHSNNVDKYHVQDLRNLHSVPTSNYTNLILTFLFTVKFDEICTSDYAINSILYQRGIYPSESFDTTTKYNLKIVETCDDKLKEYLNNVLAQLEGKLKLSYFYHFNWANSKLWASCNKNFGPFVQFTEIYFLIHIVLSTLSSLLRVTDLGTHIKLNVH